MAKLAGLSRSVARSLIEGGGVTCDGSWSVPSDKAYSRTLSSLRCGRRVRLHVAGPLAFHVVYGGPYLGVIDKPAGGVARPGAGSTGVTLAAGVLHRWPSVRGVGSEDRWGIVHRLDRDTSGLLVVALTADAESGLRAAIKGRRVSREYLALVHGAPGIPTGTVEAPLGRDPARPTRMRVDPLGRPATTHYRVEERLGDMTSCGSPWRPGARTRYGFTWLRRTHRRRPYLRQGGGSRGSSPTPPGWRSTTP